MTYTIISNKAQCLVCGYIIESRFRHDFASCKCGNIFVDGGKEYLRRGFKAAGTFMELSETEGE